MSPKILVIDDEENIRFAFGGHLSDEGYDVMAAEDYDSAVQLIADTDLDVIIADIILGERTGIDILEEVNNRGMNCPVVMITGKPDIKTAADAVRLGAFDYLPKPVHKETLLHVTNQALKHKILVDEKIRLEEEKERYRLNLDAIFGSLDDAVICVDLYMRLIEANEKVGSICGLPYKEIIGEKLTDITCQCRQSCHHVMERTLKTNNTVREFRVECGHEDRPRQIVSMSSSPLISQDTGIIGAVLVIRDITKLDNMEKELRERNQFHKVIGKGRKMQELFRLLEDLSHTETTVLITGETGSGKEMVAKAIHYESVRASNPLITVNCSALAENLLESELFGHVKGAFTGAVNDKTGRFQAADGGTIFLDEIGDISPLIQVKLLRVLEEKEIERVGDSIPVKVDVRIIAATHHNLKEMVTLGEFRQDLYYRLNVIEVNLPPLIKRREDIPLLVDHFCERFNEKLKKNIEGISDEVLKLFMGYDWPGNIRELEHALEHAFVLCHDRVIMVDHLPLEIREFSKDKIRLRRGKSADESKSILQALNRTEWNKAKAARLLGISRTTLYQKIRGYNLTKPIE